MIQLLNPTHWKDYELIDCGDFEKLERFGNLVLSRPEPQAVWKKVLSPEEWKKRAHITFRGRSATSGDWVKHQKNAPDRWNVNYQNNPVPQDVYVYKCTYEIVNSDIQKITRKEKIGIFTLYR